MGLRKKSWEEDILLEIAQRVEREYESDARIAISALYEAAARAEVERRGIIWKGDVQATFENRVFQSEIIRTKVEGLGKPQLLVYLHLQRLRKEKPQVVSGDLFSYLKKKGFPYGYTTFYKSVQLLVEYGMVKTKTICKGVRGKTRIIEPLIPINEKILIEKIKKSDLG